MNKDLANKKLEEAYDLYAKSIEKFCFTRLGEAAGMTEDCVQETFLIYYNKLLDGQTFENVRAFLYKTADIMVKRAKEKYYKNAKRHKDIDDVDESQGREMDFDEIAFRDLDYDRAKDILLEMLTDSEKELYRLKYVEKKSLKEIGEILKIPASAVANRTSRLRGKVKKLIEPILNDYAKGGKRYGFGSKQ